MEFNPIKSIVHNEDCDLHYWYQGKGPLLLCIPGGNGHGRQFNAMIAALSDRFTCATFDRRQMSASQVKVNEKMNPVQQARDIRAVIQAVGFEKAILFGSSMGGILAFQFAHDFPGMVDHLISHEGAFSNLLPDVSAIYEWFRHLVKIHQTQGQDQAAAEFEASLIGYGDEGIPKTVPPEPENVKNFWENEFPAMVGYMPNLWRLKETQISIGVMRGVRCKEAFFARATSELAKVLDCPVAVVPGHHGGFEAETAEFIPHLLQMLELLESRKAKL